MSHHLEFEQWVPFPLERVFAFFSNPENLPRIMPAASSTRLICFEPRACDRGTSRSIKREGRRR